MTPKEYLSQYRLLDARINAKLEQVERLRELATKVSPSQSDGGHSSGVSDRVGSGVAAIVDMEAEINADIDKLVDLKHEIEAVINSVDNAEQRQVLELRYINSKPFATKYNTRTGEKNIGINEIMHYSLRTIHYLHGYALQNIAHNCTNICDRI